MFIDCVVIKGEGKQHACTIKVKDETNTKFIPFDLSPYSVLFRVLGAPTANAKVLVEHEITPSSDIEVDGEITDPENGEFTFCITKEDTLTLGLGKFPIQIQVIDQETKELVHTITSGGKNGEFNVIHVVQV